MLGGSMLSRSPVGVLTEGGEGVGFEWTILFATVLGLPVFLAVVVPGAVGLGWLARKRGFGEVEGRVIVFGLLALGWVGSVVWLIVGTRFFPVDSVGFWPGHISVAGLGVGYGLAGVILSSREGMGSVSRWFFIVWFGVPVLAALAWINGQVLYKDLVGWGIIILVPIVWASAVLEVAHRVYERLRHRGLRAKLGAVGFAIVGLSFLPLGGLWWGGLL